MANEIERFLGRSLTSTVGQPLRVAVYSRIADGIRSGVFELGSALPRETELGVALGVSRTVVREALMLLEEDGLIITRRGIGRFVADDLPRVGLEELRPLEQALSDGDDDVVVRTVSFDLQSTTDFTSSKLALDPAATIAAEPQLRAVWQPDGEWASAINDFFDLARLRHEMTLSFQEPA